MAWSGGNFTRANPTWVSDAANGIGIEPLRHDTQDNDFTTGIDQCLNKTGQNGMTGALSMGSNKITNLTAGTARTDAAQVGQVQDGTSSYLGTTGGTATAFTVTATPTITALVTGAQYSFKANAANGVAATLKINGTTATTMQRQGTALVGNEFVANDIVTVVYDGTNFQIVNVATAPLYVDRTNGRVGIGTTAPTSALQVTGAIDGTPDAVGVHIGMSGGTAYGSIELCGVTGGLIDFTSAGVDVKGRIIYTNSDNAMSFNTNGAERVKIDGNGQIGVATTPDASTRLLVNGSGTTSATVALTLRDSGNTNLFYVRNDGLVNTGLKGQSPYNNTVVVGANMYVDVFGTLIRATSSIKYKTDVQTYDKGLAELVSLRPVYFKDKNNPSIQAAGLIAEELHAAGLTEFVQYGEPGEPEGISYGHMIAITTSAIQELNAKVEALEARIAALEA